MSASARCADLVGLGLGPRDQVAADLLGRLPRLFDDAAGFLTGAADLREVLLLLGLGLGARPLGGLEVVADPVLARLLHVLDGRHAELPHDAEEHQERQRTPDDLVGRGHQRVRGLLAVVDRLALGQLLVALLVGLAREARFARLLRERGRGDQQHRHDDAEDCDDCTDALTHRSSCPGQPEMMKARTKPKSASASVNAMPRNIVVRTVPADSG